MNKEYYSGSKAVVDYLRPSVEKYVPLVELPLELNPYFVKYGIRINAKLMNTLPLSNVKSLPAWQMLEDAGNLTDIHLIEASSGNTVLSLALLAPHFGAKGVLAIASPDVSEGKLTLLKLAGVNIRLVEGPICPNPNDPDGAIAIARREGEKPGNINLGQYDNDANPKAHGIITGPQLVDQLDSNIGLFCAGLGTTGTLVGTARYLRKKIPGIKIAGVVRTPNNPVPGVRTTNGLSEVAFPWDTTLTEPLVEVSEKESYAASLLLIRSGLLVGPSAGFAYTGLLSHLDRLEKNGEIETLRNQHVVFICPDTPFPYMNDYEKILGSEHFPAIENAHLRTQQTAERIPTIVPGIDVEAVHDLYDRAEVGHPELMKISDAVLIDVRELDEYNDHHLPDSTNIPLAQLPKWIKTLSDDARTRVIFVCRSGNRSARATHLARQMEVNAYNMEGGLIEWSARRYPRIKNPFCVVQ